MPAGDGTGPMGMGRMTGRAAGYCAGYGMPGYANPMPGRGLGMGWGRGSGGGRGWRNMYYATGLPGWARFGNAPAWGTPPPMAYGPYAAAPTREQEAEFLKAQADALKQQLDVITQRIDELGREE
ncbi:MAG: DUF5320 domain-containing protein [Chloroflexi bacterium]|nr:DUF5320 domain-containing protein [Chloroflexota bacterium]